ncbi:cytochrome P450 [Rhizophagus clarus]|uniref:Cytochrome P450 n=1 Tax=Rhizophagus clarus TaxID=94130 RepID=A0A8H3M677_9GLOM|nr:cytochrome P450 [Rhizophagus clarus]
MNVLVAILALIAFIASKIYQLIKVPKGLENVPTINFLSFFVTMAWFDGEWILIVTDLGLIKDIITKTDLYPKSLLKESFPKSLLNQYYGENLLLSNGDVSLETSSTHRRIANPSFRNLPVHIFVESVMKLLNVMEKVDNEPIEIKNYMHRMTLDVLGRAAFGFDFNV